LSSRANSRKALIQGLQANLRVQPTITHGMALLFSHTHDCFGEGIIDVASNTAQHSIAVVDLMGVVTLDTQAMTVTAQHRYPNHQKNVFQRIVHAPGYNVYFVAARDCTIRVLNKDLVETGSVASSLRTVLCLAFHAPTGRLFVGGVGGVACYSYDREEKGLDTAGHHHIMQNYVLNLQGIVPSLHPAKWCTLLRCEVSTAGSRVLAVCETDLMVIDPATLQVVFRLSSAHEQRVTGFAFSSRCSSLITGSRDGTIRGWTDKGALVKIDFAHLSPIVWVSEHPQSDHLFMTASLDGVLRIWDAYTVTPIQTLHVIGSGLRGILDAGPDNFLCFTAKVWSTLESARTHGDDNQRHSTLTQRDA
jgi:WD40 repeat protein